MLLWAGLPQLQPVRQAPPRQPELLEQQSPARLGEVAVLGGRHALPESAHHDLVGKRSEGPLGMDQGSRESALAIDRSMSLLDGFGLHDLGLYLSLFARGQRYHLSVLFLQRTTPTAEESDCREDHDTAPGT